MKSIHKDVHCTNNTIKRVLGIIGPQTTEAISLVFSLSSTLSSLDLKHPRRYRHQRHAKMQKSLKMSLILGSNVAWQWLNLYFVNKKRLTRSHMPMMKVGPIYIILSRRKCNVSNAHDGGSDLYTRFNSSKRDEQDFKCP